MKLLVEKGADLRKDGILGFPITLADRRPEILRYLISRGAKYPEGHFVTPGYKDLVKKTNMEKAEAIRVGVQAHEGQIPPNIPAMFARYLGARRKTRRHRRRS
jgi:hypothetical protein